MVWFSDGAARRGAEILGVDGREEPIARANLIKEYFKLDNAKYIVGDIEDKTLDLGIFDAILFYGILYHLADPITVLKRLGELTTNVISIQTFIHALEPDPVLKLVYEAVEEEGNGLTPLVTVPSQSAVVRMLNYAGFDRVFRAMPNPYFPRRINSNAQNQWAFFYGVKGDASALAARPDVVEITDTTPALNPYNQIEKLTISAKRIVKRKLGRVAD